MENSSQTQTVVFKNQPHIIGNYAVVGPKEGEGNLKEYFDYVIDKIPEKDKSKMLVVGDSQSSDILGGINSGIDTCWYNPQKVKGKYTPTYEIESLEQLKEIL